MPGPRSGRCVTDRRLGVLLCVAASAGDLVVFQQNLANGLAVSLPFLAVAVVQLALARRVWVSPRTAETLSAVLVLGLLIGLQAVAVRSGATALGPRGEPLRADPLVTVALFLRLAALLCLVRALSGRGRSWAVNGLLVVGAVVWTLRLTGLPG
ncbi:hypothetical protein CW362_10430 [Streptomyces populi]|uniref:Uncharacterized protein n=1 Tax=Streptomyces populi TaxID=2058924 RepID=A0A2I0ST74_9ACTN|nr:hypothetical protein CW362_10430 [Streptomyces populi]